MRSLFVHIYFLLFAVAPAVCTLFAKSIRVVNTPLLGFFLVRRVARSLASPSCPHIRCTHRKYLSSATTPSASASNLSASIVHRPASKPSFYPPSENSDAGGCSKRLRSAALRVSQVLEQRAHGLGGGRPAGRRCVADAPRRALRSGSGQSRVRTPRSGPEYMIAPRPRYYSVLWTKSYVLHTFHILYFTSDRTLVATQVCSSYIKTYLLYPTIQVPRTPQYMLQ